MTLYMIIYLLNNLNINLNPKRKIHNNNHKTNHNPNHKNQLIKINLNSIHHIKNKSKPSNSPIYMILMILNINKSSKWWIKFNKNLSNKITQNQYNNIKISKFKNLLHSESHNGENKLSILLLKNKNNHYLNK
jgi:hypothetical protein